MMNEELSKNKKFKPLVIGNQSGMYIKIMSLCRYVYMHLHCCSRKNIKGYTL